MHQDLLVRKAGRSLHAIDQLGGAAHDQFQPVLASGPQAEAMLVQLFWRRVEHAVEFQDRERVLQVEATGGMQPTPYGWRLTKIEEERKIDAAVALSIAAFIAETAHIEDGAGPQIAVF